MKTSDLIGTVAKTLNKPKTVVRAVLQTTNGVIAAALAKGEDVKIEDWGSFKPKVRAARTGRNPRTGEAMQIPARREVVFKPATWLKEKVLKSGV